MDGGLVDVFGYNDFRAFLRDWIERGRRSGAGISYRWFAQRLNSTDPGLVHRVVTGRRPLPSDRLEDFVEVLALEPDEADYFRALVELAQAPTKDLQAAAHARCVELRSRDGAGDVARADILEMTRSWLVPVILEMVEMPAFVDDPGWIAAQTDPPATPEEVVRAIEVGTRLGYLARREGRLVRTDPTLQTAVRVPREATWEWHRDALGIATDGLARLPADQAWQRETCFVGGTYAVPASRIPELCKIFWELQHKISGLADEWAEPADRVVQVTFSLIPVARGDSFPTEADPPPDDPEWPPTEKKT